MKTVQLIKNPGSGSPPICGPIQCTMTKTTESVMSYIRGKIILN